eukprot:13787-Chlamydomonas_euryale.AAC.1
MSTSRPGRSIVLMVRMEQLPLSASRTSIVVLIRRLTGVGPLSSDVLSMRAPMLNDAPESCVCVGGGGPAMERWCCAAAVDVCATTHPMPECATAHPMLECATAHPMPECATAHPMLDVQQLNQCLRVQQRNQCCAAGKSWCRLQAARPHLCLCSRPTLPLADRQPSIHALTNPPPPQLVPVLNDCAPPPPPLSYVHVSAFARPSYGLHIPPMGCA